MTPKWGFEVAMLPVGAACFYQADFGRTTLPKWLLWAHLFYSVFYSVLALTRACFRQARVAQAVLPPGAFFHAGAFALPPRVPKSHMCPHPHLGLSENDTPAQGKNQNPPDRGQSRKIRFSKFPGSGLKKI